MAYNENLPTQYKIVDATAGPVTTNGGLTSDYVSLKNAHKAWIVLKFKQAVSHATVIQPVKATAVAPTGNISITTAVPYWSGTMTTSADTLTKQTAATSVTLATGANVQMVIIEIDPDALGEGYDVIGFTLSDSSQATNFVDGTFWLAYRYKGASMPSAIVD